jgi:hypothetical protein
MPQPTILVSHNEFRGFDDAAMQALFDDLAFGIMDDPVNEQTIEDPFLDGLLPIDRKPPTIQWSNDRPRPTTLVSHNEYRGFDDAAMQALFDDVAFAMTDDPMNEQPIEDPFLDGLELFEDLFIDLDKEVFKTPGFQQSPPQPQPPPPEKSSSSPLKPINLMVVTNHPPLAAGATQWQKVCAVVMTGPGNVRKKNHTMKPNKSERNKENDPKKKIQVHKALIRRRPPTKHARKKSSRDGDAVGTMIKHDTTKSIVVSIRDA